MFGQDISGVSHADVGMESLNMSFLQTSINSYKGVGRKGDQGVRRSARKDKSSHSNIIMNATGEDEEFKE